MKKYDEAAVEVLDILVHTNKEDVKKIPQSFIKFLVDVSSKTYSPKFNYEQPIKGLNLRKETKELLGFMYITWWSDNEEKKEYKKQICELDMKNNAKIYNYNSGDIFKNKKVENKIENNNIIVEQHENIGVKAMTEYKKENILLRFFKSICKFLKLHR